MLAPFFDDKIGNSRDMFKALALSIKSAIKVSKNLKDVVPSTKGKLINDGEK